MIPRICYFLNHDFAIKFCLLFYERPLSITISLLTCDKKLIYLWKRKRFCATKTFTIFRVQDLSQFVCQYGIIVIL